MSIPKFDLESDSVGVVCVELVFTHPHGSVSHYVQDFSLACSVSELKEDMAAKMALPSEWQVWKYKGLTLKDDQTLANANVNSDDVIEVTRKHTG